jgi:SAM-dependent methyltransferase
MTWEPVWEEIFQRQEWGKYPAEDLIRFIARNFYDVPDRKEVKLLEIGCGPGGNLWYMAREGFAVYGIDGSPTAVKRAKERLDGECPGWKGEIVTGDFSAGLPFEDAFFNAVIDNEAVYCNPFESSKFVYKECHRILKESGKLFSRTFATGSWGQGIGENVGHNAWLVDEGVFRGKGYTRFTSKEDIAELFGDFDIEEIELLTRTVGGLEHEIREWLITVVKSSGGM